MTLLGNRICRLKDKAVSLALSRPFGRRSRRKYSRLVDVTAEDYLRFLGTVVARDKGIKDENGIVPELSRITYEPRNTGGTSISRNGFFGEATFHYKNSQRAELFFKFCRPSEDIFGKSFQNVLAKRFGFIPKMFEVGDKYRHEPLTRDSYRKLQKNEPRVYERVSGSTLGELVEEGCLKADDVDRLFSNMWQVYDEGVGNDNFKADLFSQRLAPHPDRFYNHAKNKVVPNNIGKRFIERYDTIRAAGFKGAGYTLIHGDLNPDNAFSTGDVIDWDEGQLGMPYQDLYYFSVISGFERAEEYQEQRKRFLERHAQTLPISEQQAAHFEFETNLRLLLRYNSAISNMDTKEKREQMADACRYLLEGCRRKISRIEEITGEIGLAEGFGKYIVNENSLMDISRREYKGDASIQRAHTLNYLFGSGSSEVMSKKNFDADSYTNDVSRALMNIYKTCIWGTYAGIAACIAGSVYIGAETLGEMPTGVPLLLGITAVGAGLVNLMCKQSEIRNDYYRKRIQKCALTGEE